MGVNLRGGNAFMPKQGLNIHQLHVLFQQPRGVGVPEFVWRDLFFDAGFLDQLL